MKFALSTAIAASLLATTSLAGQAPIPVATLIRQVDIPHQQFTLANGLRVIVHTDRKAPDRRCLGLVSYRVEG